MAKKVKKDQKAVPSADSKPTANAVPGSLRLTAQTFQTLKRYWKPLGGIFLVYAFLNLFISSGFGSLNTNINEIKDNLDTAGGFSTRLGAASDGFFNNLIGNSGESTSESATILHKFLIILISLVIIWALRQLLAGEFFSTKQAYYRSMSPLVPFILIILVIFLQLIPLALGSILAAFTLTSIFSGGGLAVTIFCILFGFMLAATAYLLSKSIIALYVVTLPDMQPVQALRSAGNLVKYRRWVIARKLIFLPIFMVLLVATLVIPLILIAVPLVAPVFFTLSCASIFFVHTYLYSLYRSLL